MLFSGCAGPAGDSGELLEDFDCFFRQFELAHPDPYSAFGGKRSFRRGVKALRRELGSSRELTADGLQAGIARFLVPLHDGHTYCGHVSVARDSEPLFLPLNLRAMSDGFFVWGAADMCGGLLGARLNSVGGLSLDELLDRLSVYMTSENKYGLYSAISGYQLNSVALGLLLDDFDGSSVRMDFTTSSGADTTAVVPLFSEEDFGGLDFLTCPTDQRFPSSNLEYKWADEELGVMVFKCSSVISRDCLEYMRDQGMGEFESTLRWAWGDTPLEEVPAIAERFGEMLLTMKEAGAQHLVIDLRGNGGGWTPVVYPVLYQLFGDDYLKADMDITYDTRISELYLEKNNVTLDEYNTSHGCSVETGDIVSGAGMTAFQEVTDSLRDAVIDSYMCLRKDMLRVQRGNPLYRPEHIYVVTNEQTFSAAFHFAFFLWKMGATVVGVPSSQAPNTYMEVTPFTLPNTGIQCSVSNSVQCVLPSDDPRAKVFWPDWMPTWEEYRSVGFDSRADLLLLLSRIASSL